MKKHFFITLACCLFLLFTSCSDSSISTQFDERGSEKITKFTSDINEEADAAIQEEANLKIGKLMQAFGANNALGKSNVSYPDYYGGSFISDKGILTIYISGKFSTGKKEILKIIDEDKVKFKPAKFSYRYLTELMDELNLWAITKENPSLLNFISTFGVMDEFNTIEVNVLGLDEYKKTLLEKSIFGKEGIKFTNASGRVNLETIIYPGCAVDRTSSMATAGSVGFKAKRNSDGKIGFVTAGHAISVGETAYYGTGTAIGTCANSKQSGTVDAAFVILNNTTTDEVSNVFCGTVDNLSLTTTLPGVGTVINKRGRSTGATSGKVLSTNTSIISATGETIDNMSTADYSSNEGDSGGTVYTYISSTGARPTAGIHMGAIGSTRYFTKATNILTTFGLSRN
ncbi:S1 family peptidase [uncultured Chryseobacterium sp.]|uniref:S1 family peptidase n=1 Tax=uncultured Chryseobacterium sp. TaxID=259322 RepID=UPI0026093C6B|nr:S1 family peptidase [uncultured Chryseobacterium sp.]